jgi:hypothetical protein
MPGRDIAQRATRTGATQDAAKTHRIRGESIMKNPVRTGTMIAFAAASLLAAACGSKSADQKSTTPTAGEKSAAVHCAGINSCKGMGSCKSEKNACKGQNGCKGQGVTDAASADECTSKGGTVAAGN